MLKLFCPIWIADWESPAAFRRLCVETNKKSRFFQDGFQPPSGGCVLKHSISAAAQKAAAPAAFRRLCVETPRSPLCPSCPRPAAFRRLCVETLQRRHFGFDTLPAAFRRLCVETSCFAII